MNVRATADDIEDLANRCDEISRLLRQLKTSMAKNNMALEINLEKPLERMGYLKQWADKATDKHGDDIEDAERAKRLEDIRSRAISDRREIKNGRKTRNNK